jgi:hypothetical protein
MFALAIIAALYFSPNELHQLQLHQSIALLKQADGGKLII